MKPKPKIKLKLSIIDMLLEITSWVTLITLWGIIIIYYSNIPETIPIHYNAVGEADSFGGKEKIWVPLIVVTILFIGLTIFNKFPHVFNYLTTITKDNMLRQYTNATRLIRYLKLAFVVIFGYIILKSTQISELGAWFLPLMVGLLFIPLVFFVIKSLK